MGTSHHTAAVRGLGVSADAKPRVGPLACSDGLLDSAHDQVGARFGGRIAMAHSGGSEHFETVIVGGGQAGLAVGYYLAQAGRSVVILETNDRIGDSWRRRWDSLRVSLPPGMTVCRDGRFRPRDGRIRRRTRWRTTWSPTPPGSSFRSAPAFASTVCPARTACTWSGQARPDSTRHNVVVAIGGYHVPRIPAFASELDPGITQFHSTEYRNPIAAASWWRAGGRRRQLRR